MKLWLWRDAMFKSELKDDARKEFDIKVMRRLFGPPEKLDRIWRKWLSTRKNSFHYVDWGWEQSGDTLWSYGWPNWARYAQTNINLPLNEKPGKRRWVLDYPQSALPSPLIGTVKRGGVQPSVGAIVSFARSHNGKAGLAFGVEGESDKKKNQQFLAIIIESKSDFNKLSLVFEGTSPGMRNQHTIIPKAFVDVARASGYKIGMTVKVANNRVDVTLRSGDKPLTFTASLRIKTKQRKRLISMPWAIISRDGKHGLTIYPDVLREKIDTIIPTPPGRYRFAGQYDLYGLYRAAWRLGDKAPKSLLALKRIMTKAFDKDLKKQQAAINLYKKHLLKVATDVIHITDKETGALALGDILGISLSLDLDCNSTKEKPLVTAYLRSRQTKKLEATIQIIAPTYSKNLPQKVIVKNGKPTRTALNITKNKTQDSIPLIHAEGTVKWKGLTAKAHATCCF